MKGLTFIGPKVTTPKIEKSTDFVHYFLKGPCSLKIKYLNFDLKGRSSLEGPMAGFKDLLVLGITQTYRGPRRPREGPLGSREGHLWHIEGALLDPSFSGLERAVSDLEGTHRPTGPSWIYRRGLLELFGHIKNPTPVGFSKGPTSPWEDGAP